MSESRLPLARYYRYMFLPGLLLLLLPGMIRIYLLMPFPGSQGLASLSTIYALDPWVVPLRILGVLLVILPLIDAIMKGRRRRRVGAVVVIVFSLGITYLTTEVFDPNLIFREPQDLKFSGESGNKVPTQSVVIGVEHAGVAKAYPVNYLAYHHKVRDTVGGLSVLVTYCSLCRTGDVYSPEVDHKPVTFTLVGLDRFNAVLEDEGTGSWWNQTSGEAVVGPLKGTQLPLVPSEQMTLGSWLRKHPNSLVMQPDPASSEGYAQTEKYDYYRPNDTAWASWSWVVGASADGRSKAYPWSELVATRVVNDQIGSTPVVVAVESDTTSFHVWNRNVDGQALDFALDSTSKYLRDAQTGSLWDWTGICVDGSLVGKKLGFIQSSQEYWHAWQSFQPETTKWVAQR